MLSGPVLTRAPGTVLLTRSCYWVATSLAHVVNWLKQGLSPVLFIKSYGHLGVEYIAGRQDQEEYLAKREMKLWKDVQYG